MKLMHSSIIFAFCFSFSTFGMSLKKVARTHKNRYTVQFISKVLLTCESAETAEKVFHNYWDAVQHPMISPDIKPYPYGNSGLFNATLQNYSVTSTKIPNGIEVTAQGVVTADGVILHHHKDTKYNSSIDLEAVVLGAITENFSNKDQAYDNYYGGTPFEAAIKHEWTYPRAAFYATDGPHLKKYTDLVARYCNGDAKTTSISAGQKCVQMLEQTPEAQKAKAKIKMALTNFSVRVNKE